MLVTFMSGRIVQNQKIGSGKRGNGTDVLLLAMKSKRGRHGGTVGPTITLLPCRIDTTHTGNHPYFQYKMFTSEKEEHF